MNSPRSTLRNWTVTAFVFAVLYSIIAVVVAMAPAETATEGEPSSGLMAAVVVAIAAFLWLGAFCAATQLYSAARVLLIIGGVLGFPLGVVMILAGLRIGKAGRAVEAAEPTYAVAR